jgi:hypothetical protein
MGSREAKYCLDQKHIKWSLVEGLITRKGAQDGPHDGQTLPVSQIKVIEKTQLQITQRSALGWPVTLLGLVVLALSFWIGFLSWLAAAPGLVFGLLLLLWGVKRIPAQTETIGAFRIVAPVANPDDWVMAGEVPEVQGFIDGVRADMAEEGRQKQPASR